MEEKHTQQAEEEPTLPQEFLKSEDEITSASSDRDTTKLWKLGALVGLALVVLLAGFTLTSGSDTDNSSTADQESQQSEDVSETAESLRGAEPKLDTIVYAFGEDQTSEKQLYSRTASGGDREEINALVGSSIFTSAEDDGTYVFYDESKNAVFYAEGTALPSKVLDIAINEQVTGLQVDAAAQKVAISTTSAVGESDPVTQIRQYDLDGSNEVELISNSVEDGGTHFIVDWNPESKEVLYRNSCFNCDGYNADLLWTNGSDTKVLVDAGGFDGLASRYAVSDDFSKLLYVRSSEISDADRSELGIPFGLGTSVGAPHTLIELDLSSEAETELTTYGKVNDLTESSYPEGSVAGWTADERPFYTFKNQLFVQNNSGAFDLLFETGQGSISSVLGIAGGEVLVGSQTNGGEIISYFNVDTQESAIVMETTFNTRILTVTN